MLPLYEQTDDEAETSEESQGDVGQSSAQPHQGDQSQELGREIQSCRDGEVQEQTAFTGF